MKVIVDSYAWVEYFEGSPRGAMAKNIIEDDNNEILTSAVTVSEIVSKSERAGENSDAVFTALTSISRVLPIDENTAKEAGKKHAEMRKRAKNFGLADAFILAQSEKNRAKILSGDKHFKGLKETIFIGD